jgi:glycosyltransferase involved in cell wall biosynthesis
MNPSRKILIFAPSSSGGIAEHTHYQADALVKDGARVTCLVSPSFLNGRRSDYHKISCLPDPVEGASGIAKKLRMAWRIIWSRYLLAWQIIKLRPDLILLDSYVEYLAPLWVDPHIILSRILGFRYAANLHDPVRSFAIGPLWWHRLSVWLAYQPLDFVLVHHELADRSIVPMRVQVVVAPHGLYDVNLGDFDSVKVREEWGIHADQKVFLSFGYVRDGKNLDLAIKALRDVPKAVLVVAGTVASTKDKTFQDYRDLAIEMGVADRCRFFEGYLSDEELGKYFASADYVLLTYSSSFHSQSGVLNLAAKARKPVLASASPSPLIQAVRQYLLGVAVEPDSSKAIADGMKSLIHDKIVFDWNGYEESASWDVNARRVLEAGGLLEACKTDSLKMHKS